MMMTGVAPLRGTSHGGATMRPPASIARRFSCERRAQSSSATSSGDDADARERGQRAPRGVARAPAVRKNTRQRSSLIVVVDGGGLEVVEQRVEAIGKGSVVRREGSGSRAPDTQPKMSFTFSKNGLSAPSPPRRLELLLRQRLRQLLEQVLLFLGQLLRHRDPRDGEQIALAAARDVRHPLAAQLEPRARLRAGRHLDLFVARPSSAPGPRRRARASGS